MAEEFLAGKERALHRISLRDVFDGQQYPGPLTGFGSHPHRIQKEDLVAEACKGMFELEVLEAGIFGGELFQLGTEVLQVEHPATDLEQVIAFYFISVEAEGAVKGMVDCQDAHIGIQHNEGLTDGLDDSLHVVDRLLQVVVA